MPIPPPNSPIHQPNRSHGARPPAIVAPFRRRWLDERVEAVLELYRDGWFPMNDPDADELRWVQTNRRGIIPIEADRFVVSRSLRSVVRAARFSVTTDLAFSRVIRECAQPAKGRESTWIDPTIIALFEHLHSVGLAHSVEAWVADSPTETPRLVGGVYGLALGGVFCGESMFSRPALGGTNASKVCLVHLVHHLRRQGFTLLDAQLTNDHLEQFGCYTMPRDEYITRVAHCSENTPPWQPFEPDRTIAELARRA